MSSFFAHVACLECGFEMPADINLSTCQQCGSQWLDARYDYESVGRVWPSALAKRDHSLWRYAELLPLPEMDAEVTMGEGFTSLTRLYTYERLYHHNHLYIKDERQGPTSSFKDRQAALSVMAMKRAGIGECVLASTGNAGAAYAAYCARAGIKLWLFLTSLVSSEKMREAALYGAEVVKVSGTYDETKHVAAEFARRKGIHLDRGAKAIPGKESMKTLAFEIAEQLGLKMRDDGRWQSPDWYIQAVSGGIGPLGVWKGFEELHRMGLVDRMPRLGIIQAAGCAPMVQAFNAGHEQAAPVIPRTLITVLATGDPGYSYVSLRQACLSNGGTMRAIEDGQTFEAMRRLASKTGLSVEPATAVAFAGLEQMLQDGTIAPDEVVVVNCSGHTFTAESHILGDQYVHDLQLTTGDDAQPAHASEGLDSAIRILDEQVTSILVVDDNPSDRRLIRKLLQRYKRYRIHEAASGREALSLIRDHQPDLVISDLTMPEMDGFTLLETLRNDPATAHIPVVVVSAKALTEADARFLNQYSSSVWSKAGFDTSALVEHIVAALGDAAPLYPGDGAGLQPQPFRTLRTAPAAAPTTETRARVVVIDDSPGDLRLVRRLLESDGHYEIIEAASGRAGLKAVHEHHPDLVVLDLTLPEMDGTEVLQAMRGDPHLRDIPVIIISARQLSGAERARMEEQAAIIEKATLDRRAFLYVVHNALR
ncbi:MAG: pyridoxal-phosphate dependent enzyme [Anaerolineae bacterium]|nr:pyridoxal-phosphate dependent enzyme [Anaerolineae bacterium]